MRKSIVRRAPSVSESCEPSWLNLSELARVEVTSEDSDHPVDSVFANGEGTYWRSAAPGKQSIRLIFDKPQSIKRIYLLFEEREWTRSQEFAVRCSGGPDDRLREVVRQQWNFSPDGSTFEAENYVVDLSSVSILELSIDPDRRAGEAHAKLSAWRVA